MISKLLQIIAPHHCYGCNKTGVILCSNCKYDITSEPFSGCIVCRKPSTAGVCMACTNSFNKAWCVGERHDTLETIINAYKFDRLQSSYKILAELIDETMPVLPSNTLVVGIPTVPAHVRQRGYDHVDLIVKEFCKLRKLEKSPVLRRVTSTTQRGASRAQRLKHAKAAFEAKHALDDALPYLLIDDVVTTGATIEYAARALREAGATVVWVAVVARQPLDKHS